MQSEVQEETFTKVLYIVIGIFALITIIFVLDVMSGGYLFDTIVCMLVWYIPFSGPVLTTYVC